MKKEMDYQMQRVFVSRSQRPSYPNPIQVYDSDRNIEKGFLIIDMPLPYIFQFDGLPSETLATCKIPPSFFGWQIENDVSDMIALKEAFENSNESANGRGLHWRYPLSIMRITLR